MQAPRIDYDGRTRVADRQLVLYEPMHPAYVAGIIDGEGCIATFDCRRSAVPNWEIRVVVAMTAGDLVDRLHQQFAGSIHREIQRPNRRLHYRWQVHGPLAEQLLRFVLPYLIVKRRQAELALRFRDEQMPKGPCRDPAKLALKVAISNRRLELRQAISRLNQGQPE